MAARLCGFNSRPEHQTALRIRFTISFFCHVTEKVSSINVIVGLSLAAFVLNVLYSSCCNDNIATTIMNNLVLLERRFLERRSWIGTIGMVTRTIL